MNKKTLYTFQNSVHDPRKPRPVIPRSLSNYVYSMYTYK